MCVKLPAIRKFGIAIPYAAFIHFVSRLLNAGDATLSPTYTYITTAKTA